MINLNKPLIFKEVLGQDHIKDFMIQTLNQNRLYHAYLFSGQKGIGKTTLARIFAKSINCFDFKDEPCLNCLACTKNIDIIEIDGGLTRGIDQIRELIENLRFSPLIAKKKILILDEAHKLTTDAFSALLKFIEEPPRYLMFFFVTNMKENLPKPILSRFFHLDLKPFSRIEIIDFMKSHIDETKFEDDVLEFFVRKASGSIRDAYVSIINFLNYNQSDFLPVINFETKENFKKLLLQKDENIFLKDCFELICKGCDIRDFFSGLVNYLFNKGEFLLASRIEISLVKTKILIENHGMIALSKLVYQSIFSGNV